MYGQDLGIAVTNASAKILMTEISRVMPNTILISSPQIKDDKNNYEDTGEYSIFVTDYNGYPSQITHVIKVGNGLYMDEEQAIHLGIDNKTIQFNGLNNQLYVDTSFLPKASSNNYGVIKIANEVERNVEDLPKNSGISINSNGEIFINNSFLNYLKNYIYNEISKALAPIITTQTDIKIFDGETYYFPYNINNSSIQYVLKNINSNQNSICILNSFIISSSIPEQLDVQIIINGNTIDQLNLSQIKNLELSTIVQSETEYYGTKTYEHILKNILFKFEPNLTTNILEYNMTVNVKQKTDDSNNDNLISTNIFKLMQSPISTNKNEIFNITNITIDDNGKILQINYNFYDDFNIENLISSYLSNNLIKKIKLKISSDEKIINYELKWINNRYSFVLNNTDDDNNLNPNTLLVNWQITYDTDTYNDININNGICSITKTSIELFDRKLWIMKDGSTSYETDSISDSNYSLRINEIIEINKYKLSLYFNSEDSLNKFTEIENTENFNIYIEDVYNLENTIFTKEEYIVEKGDITISIIDNISNYQKDIEFSLPTNIHIPNLSFDISKQLYTFNNVGLDYSGNNTISNYANNLSIQWKYNNGIWTLTPEGDLYYNNNTKFSLNQNQQYILINKYSDLINDNYNYLDKNIVIFKKISDNKYFKCIYPDNTLKYSDIKFDFTTLSYKENEEGIIISYDSSIVETTSIENYVTLNEAISGLLNGTNIYNDSLLDYLEVKYYTNNIETYYGICQKNNHTLLTLNNKIKLYQISV